MISCERAFSGHVYRSTVSGTPAAPNTKLTKNKQCNAQGPSGRSQVREGRNLPVKVHILVCCYDGKGDQHPAPVVHPAGITIVHATAHQHFGAPVTVIALLNLSLDLPQLYVLSIPLQAGSSTHAARPSAAAAAAASAAGVTGATQ